MAGFLEAASRSVYQKPGRQDRLFEDDTSRSRIYYNRFDNDVFDGFTAAVNISGSRTSTAATGNDVRIDQVINGARTANSNHNFLSGTDRLNGRRTQQSLLDDCGPDLWTEDYPADSRRRSVTQASDDCFDSPRLTDREIPQVLTREFSHTGRDDRNAGDSEASNAKNKKPRREKYMPAQKTDFELFALETQIQKGEYFNKLCGDRTDDDNEVAVIGAGEDPPRIKSFEECNFDSAMFKNLRLAHLDRPTQIQQYVIPLILQHKRGDILANAETGSGKTASFMLPIIHRIMRIKQRKATGDRSTKIVTNAPYALILAPTRELCQQLYEEALRFACGTGVSACVSYGDMPMQANLKVLREGCDILVSTITRTQHFIRDKLITLKDLRFWVIDEMDTLINPYDSNFQALCYIKEDSDISPNHRTFLFSATRTLDDLDILQRFVDVDSMFVVSVGPVNKAASTVQQHFLQVSKYDKRERLIQMLCGRAEKKERNDGEIKYSIGRTMIFVSRKHQSERLAHELAWKGFSVININGDRLLRQRLNAIDKFSKGVYDILVTTDIASRGMNFPRIEHIVNFDLPTQEKITYIHRLGRSGRAGNVGMATSFFDPGVDSQFIDFYIETLVAVEQEVPKFMYDILEHQRKITSIEFSALFAE